MCNEIHKLFLIAVLFSKQPRDLPLVRKNLPSSHVGSFFDAPEVVCLFVWYNEWIAKSDVKDTYLTTVEVRYALLIGVNLTVRHRTYGTVPLLERDPL